MYSLTHHNYLTKGQALRCYAFIGLTAMPKRGETITLVLDAKVYFTVSNFGHKGTYGDKLYSCRLYAKFSTGAAS